jgi:hypothetical protein
MQDDSSVTQPRSKEQYVPVTIERLELRGMDHARYFAPTLFCVYLACLCGTLIVGSRFLVQWRDAGAVTAAGVFGLLLSVALGLLFWRAQRRDLAYIPFSTGESASNNFQSIRSTMQGAGWIIVREDSPHRIDARTIGTFLEIGERVSVLCREKIVLISSICDPAIGFSLTGRRRCEEHRERIRRAVFSAPATPLVAIRTQK